MKQSINEMIKRIFFSPATMTARNESSLGSEYKLSINHIGILKSINEILYRKEKFICSIHFNKIEIEKCHLTQDWLHMF